MTKKKTAVSKKTASQKKIKSENKESTSLLKVASQFVRDITESANKQINRSKGVLDGFKDYEIYWEATNIAENESFNLRTTISAFRTWIYKDNNFLLPNEILIKDDSVAMEKLKDSKEEMERKDYNRLSTSELPPQIVRDIFSKIQSIPKLIEDGSFNSVRDATSINQIKTLRKEMNRKDRVTKDAALRLRILGDVYDSKRDSLRKAIDYLDGIIESLLMVYKDTTEESDARKAAAKVVIAIEKKIRKSQVDINGYFLDRVAAMASDDPKLKSHKDHIAAAVERHKIWESNNTISKIATASNKAKASAKSAKKS